jgi:hypothetical protein
MVNNAPGSPGYIIVRYAPTNVNDHNDVVHPTYAHIAWMDAKSIDISAHLEKPSTNM